MADYRIQLKDKEGNRQFPVTTTQSIVDSEGRSLEEILANLGGPSQSITITTWAELKTMRDSSVLIPGSFYRIVDYVTTTSQEATNSAEHQFDVVLLAITSNSLLEEGWAAKHDGDVYFSENNSNLNSWKI